MKESKIKHLEFIQNVITRMNTNSFQIKKLTITIVSALFAVYTSTKNTSITLICFIPILLFWFLDSYYLLMERKYRNLYEEVIKDNTEIKLFEMKTNKFQTGFLPYLKVLLSKTIFLFYFFILLITLSLYLFINN